MRTALPLLAMALALAGCSLSAGAGVGARLGSAPGAGNPDCDNFESCDIAYQEALTNADRCHDEGGDCDDEERSVTATYADLREQTQRELASLRSEAQEREAALAEVAEAAEAERVAKGKDCSPRVHAPEPARTTHHGNGWFDSDSAAH